MEADLSSPDLVKWLKLTLVGKGLGPVRIQKLLEAFNYDLDSIFNAQAARLLSLSFLNSKIVEGIEKLKVASDDGFSELIQTCRERGIRITPLIAREYPEKLKRIPSPPLTLYLWGNSKLLEKRLSIAVVGSRYASERAREIAYDYSKYLSGQGVTIISGGARGIDSAAHQGVLNSSNKGNICVLGSGFFRIYPPENEDLFRQIIKNDGLLVSEYSPNFSGASYSFLQRNRITSGLADSVFIVAASKTGGGLNQAKYANIQKKPILCPRLSSEGLFPIEGLETVVKEYNAVQVDSPEQILSITANYSNILFE